MRGNLEPGPATSCRAASARGHGGGNLSLCRRAGRRRRWRGYAGRHSRPHRVRPIRRVERPGVGTRHRDAARHRRRLRRSESRPAGCTGGGSSSVSYDDRYEPEAAIANTKRLIDQDGVFALIGAVGTPTSMAAEPIARGCGVPFIAPFTGAEFLRDPELAQRRQRPRLVFRGNRKDRRHICVRDRGIKPRRGALPGRFLRPQPAWPACARRWSGGDLTLAGTGTYARNTTAVKTALLALRDAEPQAIVIIGAYRPSAVFTQWARKLGVDAPILNISFVGTDALAASLGPAGAGVFVTQVVPFPTGDAMPLLGQYRAALAAHDPAAPARLRLARGVYRRAGSRSRSWPARRRSRRAKTSCSQLAEIGTFDIGGFTLRLRPGRQSRLGPGIPDRDHGPTAASCRWSGLAP